MKYDTKTIFHATFLSSYIAQIATFLFFDSIAVRLAIALSFFYWVAAELFFRTSSGAKLEAKKEDDKGTSIVNVVVAMICSITPIVFLWTGLAPAASFPAFHTSPPVWVPLLALTVFAVALRFIAMRELRDFFSRTLTVRSDQKVIESGPYAWIRHPGK